MDAARSNRRYPSYTLAQLEAFVANALESGAEPNPVMVLEIADRKAGRSTVTVVPQLEGGRPVVKVGRL